MFQMGSSMKSCVTAGPTGVAHANFKLHSRRTRLMTQQQQAGSSQVHKRRLKGHFICLSFDRQEKFLLLLLASPFSEGTSESVRGMNGGTFCLSPPHLSVSFTVQTVIAVPLKRRRQQNSQVDCPCCGSLSMLTLRIPHMSTLTADLLSLARFT